MKNARQVSILKNVGQLQFQGIAGAIVVGKIPYIINTCLHFLCQKVSHLFTGSNILIFKDNTTIPKGFQK